MIPALDPLPVGKGEVRRNGKRIAILAFGAMLESALKAGETLDATVANMRFVKPMDAELVKSLALGHDLLVSIEENTVIGGAGAEVARCLGDLGLTTPLLRLGLPDHFIDHGDVALWMTELGLDADGIVEQIRRFNS